MVLGLLAHVTPSIFFSEQPFYGNYSTLDSHTNTVISHAFAYSSRWRQKPWQGLFELCEFELSRFYCNKSARIWSSKLIHVGFHQPFPTTTTVISPEKEPINGFPYILKFPVHIGTIYKLTLISSFIIWLRGYHQKTHYEAGTYLYLSQMNNPRLK